MRKFKLDLDALAVDSFETDEEPKLYGTVKGYVSYAMGGCNTGVGVCHPQEDTEDNPTANATCPNTCWASCPDTCQNTVCGVTCGMDASCAHYGCLTLGATCYDVSCHC